MGLTLTFQEMGSVFTRQPQLLLLGMALQYSVLPTIGWAISQWWALPGWACRACGSWLGGWAAGRLAGWLAGRVVFASWWLDGRFAWPSCLTHVSLVS
jgi:hypothetical protein